MARIDTLAKYQEFLEAGYTEAQAKAAVKALREVEDVTTGDLVTKDELKLSITEFKSKMAEFKSEIHLEFSEFKREIREDFLVLRQEFRGLRWLTISFGSAIIGCLLLPIKEFILAYLTK